MMPTGERGWRACREELVGMHVSFLLSSTFGRGRLEEGLTRRGRGVWMEVAAKNEVLRRERRMTAQPQINLFCCREHYPLGHPVTVAEVRSGREILVDKLYIYIRARKPNLASNLSGWRAPCGGLL